jgi:hypothetical protein
MPLLSTFGAASARGFGNLSGIEVPIDDLFNTVSALLHFAGTNNGTNNVFDDSSSSNHTITANGNVTQGSFGPFARPDGEWGVAFPRPNSDNQNIYAAYNNADTAFGTGDFTVEVFVFISVAPGSGDYANVFDFRTAGNTNHIDLYFGNSSKRLIYFAGGNTVFTSSTDLPISEWVHLALVRSSGTTTLYQNGVSVGSASDSNNFSASIFRFGSRYTDNYGMTGSISNARVVKGDAVYTSSFTPTTSPLTAITNTVFLSAQSNRFVDNSASAHTVSGVKSPSVSAFGPFLTSKVYDPAVNGASAYFDGSGDYISSSSSSDFAFGTGDFTVDFWFYLTASNWRLLLDQVYNSLGIAIWINPNRELGFWPGATEFATTAPVNYNVWNHVALVRSSGVTRIYANGVSGATYSDSNNYTSTVGFKVASDYVPETYGYEGYISNVRAVKGTAIYTSNFTPPTAPTTAVTNTKLLLNMADGQAIDSTAQNNLTLFGTAKTSTTQSKFGGASLLLDGNSDYANFPETAANDIDGSGDWTAEFFWRFNNNTSPIYQMLLTKGYGLQIYTINGGLALALSYNNSNYFISTTGGTTLSNDTWYHVAVVKNGTSYKVYLDGTSETNLGGTSSSTLGTGGGRWHLGALETAELTYPANGYIDEVRISKLARYTSNFTPPTEPFADKGR